MHEFLIAYLIEDAATITTRIESAQACGPQQQPMSCYDSERLQRIHDELVALECDDTAAIAHIAEYLIPDMLLH